ncbi:MAG: T9SS type A sorting domain-containing protein [Bacteroidales bacterium]|nr:T9SS type A sorting domain-containing protein [Bacteroidales bacterium]
MWTNLKPNSGFKERKIGIVNMNDVFLFPIKINNMNYKVIFFSIFLSLFFLGMPILSLGQQTINASIIHDGIQRDYILYIPNSYYSDFPTPLVFNFHGYGSTAFEQMIYGDFRSISDTAGFILVHPMGTVDDLGNTHWNVGWGSSGVDDIGFTSALIDSLSLDYNIDEEKIYSTGMSNGGFMSYTLACALSNRIAAIASVTGSMTVGQPYTCDCQHPMPIMEIHGTADVTVPYDGSYLFVAIEDVLNYWNDFNNTNNDPIITELPDIDPNDGCTAEHYLWISGDNNVEVEHYKIINGEHTWPGSAYDIGVTNHDMSASVEIWKFFSKYDINGMINPTALETLAETGSKIKIYPNPCHSLLNIEVKQSKPSNYQIYSMLGKLLLEGKVDGLQQEIDLSSLAPQIYYLKIGDETFQLIKSDN